MQITTDPTVFLEQIANPALQATRGGDELDQLPKQSDAVQKSPPALKCQPMLMGERDAAGYLGISVSKLRMMKLRRRVLGSRRLYDRQDLDDFIERLPYEGAGEATSGSEVDQWFADHG